MSEACINPFQRGLHGTIEIPGDKSISHRSVMLAALGNKEVTIDNFLLSADCLSTVACMQALGVAIIQEPSGRLIVQGQGMHGLHEPKELLDAGNSGTTLRLLLGIAAAQSFPVSFTGDKSLSRRPMGRVIKPLRQMGAQISGRDDTYLPISVCPVQSKLHGMIYEMPMASAQVKSALLLAGLYADSATTIIEPGVSRNHTELMLESFGVRIDKKGSAITIYPAEKVDLPDKLIVPGDISSAAYWLVSGTIIPDSELVLRNVGINHTRTGIIDILRSMGADIVYLQKYHVGQEHAADIRVRSAELHAVSIGSEIMPRLIDEIPILSVAGMYAEGDTVITGAAELRVKETDRLHAIAQEMNKISDCIDELPEGLIIHGGRTKKYAKTKSCEDHRIAMSLAVAGLAGAGVSINSSECVNISYPTFYDVIENLVKG